MLPKYDHPTVVDEPAPKALKNYVVLGQLAKGGMAELFLARTSGLGGFERLLVIKRILPRLAHDTELVRMLLDEARIAATLQHSNIVQVFDVGIDDGTVFFAMEHLHGEHVGAIVKQTARMPLENAIAIAVAVAGGLHYAHERWGADGTSLGIVHRDVSPNNVIVTYDGNVKLIDFGIAKATNNLSSTRFGLFKGKLPYASPEQCRCEPVDRRTDVYSLGVLLYELTCGHPVFVADSEYELLRLMSGAVVTRPRMRDKAYPRELEQIVLRALAREPADRYQTAEALQRDLEVFAGKSHLDLSAFSLSRLMATAFGDKLEHWRTAQRAGLTLEQHITRTTGMQPIVEPTATSRSLEPAAPAAPPARRSVVPHLRAAAVGLGLLAAGAIVGRWAGNPVTDDPVVVAAPPQPVASALQVTPIDVPTSVDLARVVEPPVVAPPRPVKLQITPKKRARRGPTRTAAAHRPDDDDLDNIVPRSTK